MKCLLRRRLFSFCCVAGLLGCLLPFSGCWQSDQEPPPPVMINPVPDTNLAIHIDPVDPAVNNIAGPGDFVNSIVINTTDVTVTIDGVQVPFASLAAMREYLIANSNLLQGKKMNVISGTNHNYKVLSDVTDILRELNISQGGIFQ